jgi:hypothetical protein
LVFVLTSPKGLEASHALVKERYRTTSEGGPKKSASEKMGCDAIEHILLKYYSPLVVMTNQALGTKFDPTYLRTFFSFRHPVFSRGERRSKKKLRKLRKMSKAVHGFFEPEAEDTNQKGSSSSDSSSSSDDSGSSSDEEDVPKSRPSPEFQTPTKSHPKTTRPSQTPDSSQIRARPPLVPQGTDRSEVNTASSAPRTLTPEELEIERLKNLDPEYYRAIDTSLCHPQPMDSWKEDRREIDEICARGLPDYKIEGGRLKRKEIYGDGDCLWSATGANRQKSLDLLTTKFFNAERMKKMAEEKGVQADIGAFNQLTKLRAAYPEAQRGTLFQSLWMSQEDHPSVFAAEQHILIQIKDFGPREVYDFLEERYMPGRNCEGDVFLPIINEIHLDEGKPRIVQWNFSLYYTKEDPKTKDQRFYPLCFELP